MWAWIPAGADSLLYFKMPSNLIEQFNQKGASWDLSGRQATWAHEKLSLISNLDWQRRDRHQTSSRGLLTVPQGRHRAEGWGGPSPLVSPLHYGAGQQQKGQSLTNLKATFAFLASCDVCTGPFPKKEESYG